MRLHPSERLLIHREVASYLKRFGSVDLYWLPSALRLAKRKTDKRAGRAVQPLPPDAIYVGRYVAPCCASVYLNDVEVVVAATVPRPPQWRREGATAESRAR